MSAGATMRQVREASYARIAAARAETATLIRARDPQRVRASLTQVARLAKRVIDETDGTGGPCLMSHARMQLAAALFDLAALETDRARRAKLLAAGTGECDTAIRVALASKAPFLSLKILPWAMVVIAGGLRASRDGQTGRLQRIMASCAKALPTLDLMARRQGRAAARLLFRAQLLALATQRVADPIDRAAVLRRALIVAREAHRMAMAAGAFATAGQAKSAIAALEERIRVAASNVVRQETRPRPAPTPAPTPPPRAAKPFLKFCPNCGTPTRPGKAFCTSCGSRLMPDQ